MDKVKLGIIGLGRLGRKHAENIYYKIPNAKLTAICSIVQKELDSVLKEMNPKYVTKDYREIINNKELDGIVIASSSDSHCQQIIDACEAGRKYIFTEKPIGTTLEEISKIKKAVNLNKGVKLQVGYHRRFDISYQAAKKKINEGFIGDPIFIKNINRDAATEEEFLLKFSPKSGGLIFDTGSHDYDMSRWLINSDAKSIYGLGGVYVYEGLKKINDIDNCTLLVEFKNNVMGQFVLSRNCTYGYHVETEIYGTKGSIRVCATPAKDRVTYFDENGINLKCIESFYDFFKPCYLAELQEFVNCIIENRQPLVTAEDGYKTVEWSFAANEAIKNKKIVYLN